MTNAHQSQGSVQSVSCYGNQQPSDHQISPIALFEENQRQGNASAFNRSTILGQNLVAQGTSYVGNPYHRYHSNPRPTTFQEQTGIMNNLQEGTPVRQRERNPMPGLGEGAVNVDEHMWQMVYR